MAHTLDDRLICEILSVLEEIPAGRVDMKRFQRPEGYWTKQEELPCNVSHPYRISPAWAAVP